MLFSCRASGDGEEPAGRISERPAAEVKRHRLFEGEADGREVRHAGTRLDAAEGRPQRLAVPGDTGREDDGSGSGRKAQDSLA